MKNIILTILFTAISFTLFSQNFEVPKNCKLEKAEDYKPFEQDIIKCFDWLIATPLNQETAKRKEANAFLLKWLMGSPNVHIEIKPTIVTFMSSSPDLLLIFMGGWAKYSLESKDFDNKVKGNQTGIEAVIKFYSTNRKIITKDKNIEKYIKMKEKGKLESYIQENA